MIGRPVPVGLSSAGTKSLPITGATPSTENMFAETTAPVRCAGSDLPVIVKSSTRKAEIPSKTWYRDQAAWVMKRKWAQQDRINYAENRTVRADAQRQRSDRHHRKARALAQLAKSVAKILKQPAHACTSAISFFSSSSATTLPSNRCTSR